ncbi:hypothetical protein GJ496_001141 [Pomphorhynchus laevis]|nr:hypothetical protein GJ496_001141 [Pomphorhynchus laevis]
MSQSSSSALISPSSDVVLSEELALCSAVQVMSLKKDDEIVVNEESTLMILISKILNEEDAESNYENIIGLSEFLMNSNDFTNEEANTGVFESLWKLSREQTYKLRNCLINVLELLSCRLFLQQSDQAAERYISWITKQYLDTNDHIMKEDLVSLLSLSVRSSLEILHKFSDNFIQLLLATLLKLLSSETTNAACSIMLNLVIFTMEIYPECSVNYFEDVFDLVVGFCLNENACKATTALLQRLCLICKESFLADFGYNLTFNIINDIEEAVHNQGISTDGVESNVDRCETLLSILYCILPHVAKVVNEEDRDYLAEQLDQLIKLLNDNYTERTNIRLQVLRCINVLAHLNECWLTPTIEQYLFDLLAKLDNTDKILYCLLRIFCQKSCHARRPLLLFKLMEAINVFDIFKRNNLKLDERIAELSTHLMKNLAYSNIWINRLLDEIQIVLCNSPMDDDGISYINNALLFLRDCLFLDESCFNRVISICGTIFKLTQKDEILSRTLSTLNKLSFSSDAFLGNANLQAADQHIVTRIDRILILIINLVDKLVAERSKSVSLTLNAITGLTIKFAINCESLLQIHCRIEHITDKLLMTSDFLEVQFCILQVCGIVIDKIKINSECLLRIANYCKLGMYGLHFTAAQRVFQNLPLDSLIESSTNHKYTEMLNEKYKELMSKVRQYFIDMSLTANSSELSFLKDSDYAIVMNYILFEQIPRQSDWLLRIFYVNTDEECNLRQILPNYQSLLWNWIIQAVIYHIEKTRVTGSFVWNLKESLNAIEECFHRGIVRGTTPNSKGLLNLEMRSRIFLQIIDGIDKHLQKKHYFTRTYFANQSELDSCFVCEDDFYDRSWFEHIYHTSVRVSVRVHYSEYTIKKMWTALTFTNSKKSEFIRDLTALTTAYIQLSCPDLINGLISALDEKYKLEFKWMVGAYHQARGNYEDALNIYKTCLESNSLLKTGEISADVAKFLNENIANCFINLGAWMNQLNWLDKVDELLDDVDENVDLERAMMSPHHPAALNALSKFSSCQYDACRSTFREYHKQTENGAVHNQMLFAKTPLLNRNQLWLIASSELVKGSCIRRHVKPSEIVTQSIADIVRQADNLDPLANHNVRFDVIARMQCSRHKKMFSVSEYCLPQFSKSSPSCALLMASDFMGYFGSPFKENDEERHRIALASFLRLNENYSTVSIRLRKGKPFNHLNAVLSSLEYAKSLLYSSSSSAEITQDKKSAIDLLLNISRTSLTMTFADYATSLIVNSAASETLQIIADIIGKSENESLIHNVASFLPYLADLETQRLVLHGQPESEEIIDKRISQSEILTKYLLQYSIILSPRRIEPISLLSNWCLKRAINGGLPNTDLTKLDQLKRLIPVDMSEDEKLLLIDQFDSIDLNRNDFLSETFFTDNFANNDGIINAFLYGSCAFSRVACHTLLMVLFVQIEQLPTDQLRDNFAVLDAISGILRLLQMFPKSVGDIILANLETITMKGAIDPWCVYIPQLLNMLINKKFQHIQPIILPIVLSIARFQPTRIIYSVVAVEQDLDPDILSSISKILDIDKIWTATRCFIKEMLRLTLMKHELCSGVVKRIEADYSSRINRLNQHRKKVSTFNVPKDAAHSLVKARQSLLFDNVCDLVSKMMLFLNEESSCKLDQIFASEILPICNDFQTQLNEDLAKLQIDKTASSTLLLTELCKRSTAFCQNYRFNINIGLVSDALLKIFSQYPNKIPLPSGTESKKSESFIQGIGQHISIVHSKTRPKRLVLITNDGNRHPYLLKGLEDLRQEERIMQLISIMNKTLENIDKDTSPSFSARCYPIVPLSSKCGLIGMVHPTTSTYHLYDRFVQNGQRNINEANDKDTKDDAEDTGDVMPVRPVDSFIKKFRTRSFLANITEAESREMCLLDLFKETPSDIISSELWFSSLSLGHWWSMTKNYTRSFALMSAVGLIIGLGDRHLGNLLIDFNNGQVVHVDYNICMDKSRHLSVPETVPFRLTRNFKDPLGIGGVKGAFSADAVKVLTKIRQCSLCMENIIFDTVNMQSSIFAPKTLNEYCIYLQSYNGGVFTNDQLQGPIANSGIEQIKTAKRLMTSFISEIRNPWKDIRSGFVNVGQKLDLALIAGITLSTTAVDDNMLSSSFKLIAEYLNDYLDSEDVSDSSPSDKQHPFNTLRSRYTEYLSIKEEIHLFELKLRSTVNSLENSSNLQTCLIDLKSLLSNVLTDSKTVPLLNEELRDFSEIQDIKELQEDDDMCRSMNLMIYKSRSEINEANKTANDLFASWFDDLSDVDINAVLGVNILQSCFAELQELLNLQTRLITASPGDYNKPTRLMDSVNQLCQYIPSYADWYDQRECLISSLWSEVELYYNESKQSMHMLRIMTEGNKDLDDSESLCFGDTQTAMTLLFNIYTESVDVYQTYKEESSCTSLVVNWYSSLLEMIFTVQCKAFNLMDTAYRNEDIENSIINDNIISCSGLLRQSLLSLQDIVDHCVLTVIPATRLAQFRFSSNKIKAVLDAIGNASFNDIINLQTSEIQNAVKSALELLPCQQLRGALIDMLDKFDAVLTELDMICLKIFAIVSQLPSEFLNSKLLSSYNQFIAAFQYSELYVQQLRKLALQLVHKLLYSLESMIQNIDMKTITTNPISDEDLLQSVRSFIWSICTEMICKLQSLIICTFIWNNNHSFTDKIASYSRDFFDLKPISFSISSEESQVWILKNKCSRVESYQNRMKECLKFKLREYELMKLLSLDVPANRKLPGINSVDESLDKLRVYKTKINKVKLDFDTISSKIQTLDQNVLKRLKWLSGGLSTDALTVFQRTKESRLKVINSERCSLENVIDNIDATTGFRDRLKQLKKLIVNCIDCYNEIVPNVRSLIESGLKYNEIFSHAEKYLINDKKFCELVWVRSEIIGYLYENEEALNRTNKRISDNKKNSAENRDIIKSILGQFEKLLATFTNFTDNILDYLNRLRKYVTSTPQIEEFSSVVNNFKTEAMELFQCFGKVPLKAMITKCNDVLSPSKLDRIFGFPESLLLIEFEASEFVHVDNNFVAWNNFLLRLHGKSNDGHTMSAEQQIENAIAEAQDTSNLAAMYEGWIAWI